MAPPAPKEWWHLIAAVGTTALVISAFSFVGRYLVAPQVRTERPLQETPLSLGDEWIYRFTTAGVLEESASPEESTSPYSWLDSGGRLIVAQGIGSTLQGELPEHDWWRRRYASSSPRDTKDGAHPQNIFRLLSRSSWENVRVEVSFRIRANHFSESENRNESNGIFIMSRYQDHNNLYYAGLRVDGHAVIKKKLRGVYTTLAEAPYIEGNYVRASSTNLLPNDRWIPLRLETQTNGSEVTLSLYHIQAENEWQQLLSVVDHTEAHLGAFPIGIRTDFMDVEFDNFRAKNIYR